MPPDDSLPQYLVPTPDGGLRWGPLVAGRLIRRYKRFLAEVLLPDGTTVTAHTANTGAMRGCSEPGRTVWLSRHDTPSRKLPYTLEMIDMPESRVGVNTGVPNKLVRAAIAAGRIPELPAPDALRSEVTFGESRLDLLLHHRDAADVYVEVKNCTLVEDGAALFPDAVTARGAR
ncbi:MAG: DNA/RNA nuclease SfsA, partial [Planctomycetes bacterium]|nr:DNA/RNA nuclease SfsA [Planctomycetota bacterium]